MSFQDDMALAWGAIFAGMGIVSLWGVATSEGVAVRAVLALFGVTMVWFGGRTIYDRTWPTREE